MKVAPVVPVFRDWCKEFAWKLVKNWCTVMNELL